MLITIASSQRFLTEAPHSKNGPRGQPPYNRATPVRYHALRHTKVALDTEETQKAIRYTLWLGVSAYESPIEQSIQGKLGVRLMTQSLNCYLSYNVDLPLE